MVPNETGCTEISMQKNKVRVVTWFLLLWNVVYQLQGTGLDGTLKHFEKPWAMTTGMLLIDAAMLAEIYE